jgi:hypothetical protein
MRVLRFICRLRGYHNHPYIVAHTLPPNEKGAIQVFGTALPCHTCGYCPEKAGMFTKSSIWLHVDLSSEIVSLS